MEIGDLPDAFNIRNGNRSVGVRALFRNLKVLFLGPQELKPMENETSVDLLSRRFALGEL